MMRFSERAAKIGRSPSVGCRCVRNSNNLILRYNDNGKQGITLREWWQRQLLQPIFVEDVALTTVLGLLSSRNLYHASLLLPFLKGVKLKSNVKGNSFYSCLFLVQAVKNGESEIKTLTNWYVSLKKMMLTRDTARENTFEYRVALQRMASLASPFKICLCWLNVIICFQGVIAGRIPSVITGDLVSWVLLIFWITRCLACTGCWFH